MSPKINPSCPFDAWEGGNNKNLKGGQLLGVTAHRFAYGFFDGTGRFVNAFIARMTHGENILSLLTAHPDEMAHLLTKVLDRMGEVDGYNVYANEGGPAGMTISDHAHLHVVRRNAGEAASGMGLGKLVVEHNVLKGKYDDLSLAYDRLAWSSGT